MSNKILSSTLATGLVGLLSMPTMASAATNDITFRFNQYIGSYYIHNVTLSEVEELCITSPCESGTIRLEVSGNAPSCPNHYSLDGGMSVTFRSQDDQAYFTRSFLMGPPEENSPFSKVADVTGYFGDLRTGRIEIRTNARCIQTSGGIFW